MRKGWCHLGISPPVGWFNANLFKLDRDFVNNTLFGRAELPGLCSGITHGLFYEDTVEKMNEWTEIKTNTGAWNALTQDPTIGVLLVTVEGEVLYINKQAKRILLDDTTDSHELVGRSVYDLGLEEEWADEQTGLYRETHESGVPVLLRTVWGGKQQFSWMNPLLPDDDDSRRRVLITIRRLPATEEAQHFLEGDHRVVNSKYVRLGALNSLTPRELEVMSLIGQGMTIKAIASALFRSVKTIENHRESIGKKLQRARAIDLACIAHCAGLRLDDSSRTRLGCT